MCIYLCVGQHMNELSAITLAKKNDRKGQQWVFYTHGEQMLVIALRYVRDVQVAEEMMQNGFLKFFQQIERFEYSGTGSLVAWLKKIVINECLMHLRKKTIFIVENGIDSVDEVEENNIFARIDARDIMNMIVALPDGYRTVFNLYAVEGFGHKEISEMLGISEGTSKSQLSKAKNMLREKIKKEHLYE